MCSPGLYEGHFGDYPTHCPLWAAMDFEHREQIIKDMGMCLKCLNPRYTLETRAQRLAHEHDKCSVAKRKKSYKYTCLYMECFLHSWVWTLHQDTNRPLLDTHAREFIKKRQYSAFVHPGFAGPGVKHWHSGTATIPARGPLSTNPCPLFPPTSPPWTCSP